MLRTLLNTASFSLDGETIKLLLYYGIILAVILATLIVMGILRRKTKSELCPEKVKKACSKAVKYADGILASGEHKGTHALLGATKLATLSKHIANAAWYGFQIVGEKKDIVIESIANELDALATEISNEAADGYVPASSYEKYVQTAIDKLNAVIAKLDVIIKK
jgi:hypothetical protein